MSEPDEVVMRRTCHTCSGKGVAGAGVSGPMFSMSICPTCLGQKEIVVRKNDPQWTLTYSSPGREKVLLAVTFGGDVRYGEPFAAEDASRVVSLSAQATNASGPDQRPPDQRLVVALLLFGSELLKLRAEVEELKRR